MVIDHGPFLFSGMHYPTRLFLLGLSLLLSSCFEIREEIWINSRGGGRIQIDYSLPRAAIAPLGGEPGIRSQVEDLLQDAPELRLDDLQITEEDDQFLIHAELSTDSMISLLDLSEGEALKDLPEAATKLIGQFQLERVGTDFAFERRVDVGSALGFAALIIPKEDRTERRMTYIIHLPTTARSHNATRTENDGQTLIWDNSLGEAIQNPTTMNFTAPIPLPWLWIITALIVLLILSAVLFRRWRRRRLPGFQPSSDD